MLKKIIEGSAVAADTRPLPAETDAAAAAAAAVATLSIPSSASSNAPSPMSSSPPNLLRSATPAVAAWPASSNSPPARPALLSGLSNVKLRKARSSSEDMTAQPPHRPPAPSFLGDLKNAKLSSKRSSVPMITPETGTMRRGATEPAPNNTAAVTEMEIEAFEQKHCGGGDKASLLRTLGENEPIGEAVLQLVRREEEQLKEQQQQTGNMREETIVLAFDFDQTITEPKPPPKSRRDDCNDVAEANPKAVAVEGKGSVGVRGGERSVAALKELAAMHRRRGAGDGSDMAGSSTAQLNVELAIITATKPSAENAKAVAAEARRLGLGEVFDVGDTHREVLRTSVASRAGDKRNEWQRNTPLQTKERPLSNAAEANAGAADDVDEDEDSESPLELTTRLIALLVASRENARVGADLWRIDAASVHFDNDPHSSSSGSGGGAMFRLRTLPAWCRQGEWSGAFYDDGDGRAEAVSWTDLGSLSTPQNIAPSLPSSNTSATSTSDNLLCPVAALRKYLRRTRRARAASSSSSTSAVEALFLDIVEQEEEEEEEEQERSITRRAIGSAMLKGTEPRTRSELMKKKEADYMTRLAGKQVEEPAAATVATAKKSERWASRPMTSSRIVSLLAAACTASGLTRRETTALVRGDAAIVRWRDGSDDGASSGGGGGVPLATCGRVICASYNKAEALKWFIGAYCGDGHGPRRIIFVDDNPSNVLSVFLAAGDHGSNDEIGSRAGSTAPIAQQRWPIDAVWYPPPSHGRMEPCAEYLVGLVGGIGARHRLPLR